MPVQKRPSPLPSDDPTAIAAGSSSSSSSPTPPPPPAVEHGEQQQDWLRQSDGDQPPQPVVNPVAPNQDDNDGGADSPLSPNDDDDDDDDDYYFDDDGEEYMKVNLSEMRKVVKCPICLGIIRKTRTVMECLHRFCRECIDKSMRLGNNECPVCRTHCASRRSLRDDPNYDALLSTLYPDIDKYEEEEFAFNEEEKTRIRKIQASIAETFRRQTEALRKTRSSAKATAEAFVKNSQGNFRSNDLRGRGRSSGRDTALMGSDDDEEDENGNDEVKAFSSVEERAPEVRQKRCRRWPGPRSSPARTSCNSDIGYEENDDLERSRQNLGILPLRADKREMLAWGRGGARSQTRHGSSSSNGGLKSRRLAKLVEHLQNLNKNDDEFDVHLTLLPLDEQSVPSLERPYLCCRPTVSVRNLCQFIAIHTSAQAEEVEIFVRKAQGGSLPVTTAHAVDKVPTGPSEALQILGLEESLADLHASFTSNQGNLVLLYHLKNAKLGSSPNCSIVIGSTQIPIV